MQEFTINARAIDWVVLVGDLLAKATKTDKALAAKINVVIEQDGTATYTFPRDLVPMADIAKMVGTTVDKVEAVSKITLTPLKGSADWQRPTVDYVGRA